MMANIEYFLKFFFVHAFTNIIVFLLLNTKRIELRF